MVITHTPDDGKRCMGVNAMELAWGLQIGSEEIFEANKSGELCMDSMNAEVPTHWASEATRMIFRIGDRTIGVNFEKGPSGNA